MLDFTQLLQAVIALAATLITVFVIPFIKSKTTAAQQERLYHWVKIAVKAAEHTLGSGKGTEKSKEVYEFLLSYGIKFDENEVKKMIESVVYGLKEKKDE